MYSCGHIKGDEDAISRGVSCLFANPPKVSGSQFELCDEVRGT